MRRLSPKIRRFLFFLPPDDNFSELPDNITKGGQSPSEVPKICFFVGD